MTVSPRLDAISWALVTDLVQLSFEALLSSHLICSAALARNAAHVESATIATPGITSLTTPLPSRMKACFTPGRVLM